MAFSFVKYHGAGNDFIMINGFDSPVLNWSPAQRAALCRRHYGIGADGIIVIRPSDNAAFAMVYYNADGVFMKAFSTYDGMATSILLKNNFIVVMITRAGLNNILSIL